MKWTLWTVVLLLVGYVGLAAYALWSEGEIRLIEQVAKPVELIEDYNTRFMIPPAPKTLTFTADGKTVGTIDFSESKVTFTGDVDKSARLFFEHVYKGYIAPWSCNQQQETT